MWRHPVQLLDPLERIKFRSRHGELHRHNQSATPLRCSFARSFLRAQADFVMMWVCPALILRTPTLLYPYHPISSKSAFGKGGCGTCVYSDLSNMQLQWTSWKITSSDAKLLVHLPLLHFHNLYLCSTRSLTMHPMLDFADAA